VRLAAQTHRNVDPVSPGAFGGLTPVTAMGAKNSVLGGLLAKLGAQREAVGVLFGPEGELTRASKNAAALEDIGAVITGVNDASFEAASALGDDPGPSGAPVALYPMAPASLADLQARATRFGGAPVVETHAQSDIAPASAVAAIDQKAPRPHAFDASEGTALDPLLNKTYDLSYAKAIPKLQ